MNTYATTEAAAIIHEMDREHDEITGVMRRLSSATPRELPVLWEGLTTYAREHFRKEELVMSIMSADAQAAHTLDHERMLQRLSDMGGILDHPHLIIDRLTSLLMDWLSDHIENYDGPLMAELLRHQAADRAWEVRPAQGGA